jgi:hypothetical protein
VLAALANRSNLEAEGALLEVVIEVLLATLLAKPVIEEAPLASGAV